MSTPPGDPDTRSQSHYFDSQPKVPSSPGIVSISLPDLSFELSTDTGVFGRHRLDPGTKILLQEAPELPTAGTFLDLGCGVGPIAATMALRRPESVVWAIDVNERALRLTGDNVRKLGLSNVSVCPPEKIPPDVRFDVIWSNPPIKVGKAVLHDLLLTWLPRLAAGGHAIIVVHKNLGSDSLSTWLRSNGWDVERILSRQGYRLLRVRRV